MHRSAPLTSLDLIDSVTMTIVRVSCCFKHFLSNHRKSRDQASSTVQLNKLQDATHDLLSKADRKVSTSHQLSVILCEHFQLQDSVIPNCNESLKVVRSCKGVSYTHGTER